jgi:hypothetical protein
MLQSQLQSLKVSRPGNVDTGALKVVGYFFPPVRGFFTHRGYFFTLVVIGVTNLWLSKLLHTQRLLLYVGGCVPFV